MKKLSSCFRIGVILCLLGPQYLHAQQKIGGMGPVQPSAILELESTSRGLLMPRLTTAQRNAITSPAKGLVVYDSTVKSFYYHDGTAWQALATTGAGASGWSLTGNSGTNPSTNFIGTTDKQNLAIRTNNVERIRVDSTGRVGIGVTNPDAPLQIGSNNFQDTAEIRLGTGNGGRFRQWGIRVPYGGSSPSTPYWSFAIRDVTADADRLVIDYGTGNVGLGTSTPHGSAALDVTSTSKGVLVPRLTTAQRNAIAFPARGLLVYDSTAKDYYYHDGAAWQPFATAGPGGSGWSVTGNSGTDPATNFIGTTDKQNVAIRTNNTERVRVDSTGNVGIGMTTPHAPLHFARTLANRKIVLWETANNDHQFYGLGIENYALRYQSNSDHAFYRAVDADSSAEMMRISSSGIAGTGSAPTFLGFRYKNTSSAAGASSDFYAVADNGSNTSHYIDMGINGSGGGIAPFKSPNHAYLYSVQDSLHIGALGTGNAIQFHTGGGINNPTRRGFFSGNGDFIVSSATEGMGYETDVTVDGRMVVVQKDNDASHWGLVVQRASAAGGNYPVVTLYKTGDDSINVRKSLGIGDTGGGIEYKGVAGNNSTISQMAKIQTHVEKVGSTYLGSALTFSTMDSSGNTVATEKMRIKANGGINANGSAPSFLGYRFQNTSTAAGASSDFYAVANNGSDNTHYIDMGINGSAGGVAPFTGANHAYMYTVQDPLHIGALGTGNAINFYTGGGISTPARRMLIAGDGSVGIGTAGDPHSSAALDVTSTTKGVLVPRLTTTQRNAIASPARGLLLYDSTAKAYYYHDGAAWQPFATAGPGGSGWSTTGNSGTNPATNFIGTTDKQNVAIRTNNIERVRVDSIGRIGIGTTTPHAPLQFSNVLGNRRLVFWESGDNDHQFYGLGVNTGALRYQSQSSHVFYRGVDADSSTELMRITNAGRVGIGTSSPGAKLEVNNGTTAGAIKIVDGTQGAGKVLTSDANGVGTWSNSSMGMTYSSYTLTIPAGQSAATPLLPDLHNGAYKFYISSGNACTLNFVNEFLLSGSVNYNSWSMQFMGGTSPYGVSTASGTSKDITVTNASSSCQDGGDGTAFNYTVSVGNAVNGAIQITNNGNITRTYSIKLYQF